MELIALTFRGLHADAPELSGDLDVIYRLVAEVFEVVVAGETLYREVEFPVVELALGLDSWLGRGMADRRELDCELSGLEPGTLRFRATETAWTIDSSHSVRGARRPSTVSDGELRRSIRSFLLDVSVASAALGIDLQDVFERVRR